MFEKEIEEYKNQSKWKGKIFMKDEEICFKDGAEFGYNKANEWHKSDIPTNQINKVVLGYIKDYNSKMFCLVKWNGEWWYDARTYNERVKLIAWREIELPKVIKENE